MRYVARSIALAVLVAGCGSSYASAPATTIDPVATTTVNLRNNAFSPAAIRVASGVAVSFTNLDGINHNLTFSSGSIISVGDYSTGTRQVVMPTVPGTYQYRCTLHAGMSGSVLVE